MYGEVGDVYIPRHFRSNDPKGFAFVRFLDRRDMEDAQRAMDGQEIDGREIKIQEAKEKRPGRAIINYIIISTKFIIHTIIDS